MSQPIRNSPRAHRSVDGPPPEPPRAARSVVGAEPLGTLQAPTLAQTPCTLSTSVPVRTLRPTSACPLGQFSCATPPLGTPCDCMMWGPLPSASAHPASTEQEVLMSKQVP